VVVANDLIKFLIHKKFSCTVYYFDELVSLDFPCEVKRISFFQKINFGNYDVIHSHMFRPDLYCAYHRKFIPRSTKLITTIHTAVDHDLRNAYGILNSIILPPVWKWAWKKMDKVVVLTRNAKEYYDLPGLKNKVEVINNGRDLPVLYDAIPSRDLELIMSLKNKYTLLGSVASFDKRKGFEQVLKLLKLEHTYAFVIIGDGSERCNLQNMAIEYGVADRFCILGSRPQGFRYMKELDLYLMPSRSEGLSLAMLEAVALKVPVVCSSIPVFQEVFSSNEVCFFDLDKIEKLQSACQTALKYKANLIDHAFKRYNENYTVERMGTEYFKLYVNG